MQKKGCIDSDCIFTITHHLWEHMATPDQGSPSLLQQASHHHPIMTPSMSPPNRSEHVFASRPRALHRGNTSSAGIGVYGWKMSQEISVCDKYQRKNVIQKKFPETNPLKPKQLSKLTIEKSLIFIDELSHMFPVKKVGISHHGLQKFPGPRTRCGGTSVPAPEGGGVALRALRGVAGPTAGCSVKGA